MNKFLILSRSIFWILVSGAGDQSNVFLRYLLRRFWEFFWWVEERLESNFGGLQKVSISGSERAVLIENVLSGIKNPRVLEVGSGYGQNVSILSSLIPVKNIFIFDKDILRVKETKNYFSLDFFKELSLLVADTTRIPFIDKKFDVVFSSAMFLYLNKEQAKEALFEMLRVSRSRVVLLEQHIDGEDETEVPGGVTSGSYFLRDYRSLIREINSELKIKELIVPNPRWAIETWSKTARVFVIEF